MQPQKHADTGFKQRHQVYVDTPLLHYLEDEYLPGINMGSEVFFEVLSVMVEEVGCAYRRLIEQQSGTNISQYKQISNYRLRIPELQQASLNKVVLTMIPGMSQGLRDQHCCPVAACILDVLMTVTSATPRDKQIVIRAQSQQHGGLLNTMLMRCQQLTGMPLHNLSVGVLSGETVVAIEAQTAQSA